jgi:tetratricopeptide (TPR) repeat protein
MTNPNHLHSENRLRRRARQYFESNMYPAAQEALESLAQRLPEDPYVKMDLSRVLMHQGKFRQATENLRCAVKNLPNDDAQFIHEIVRSLYSSGETVAVRDCLDHLDSLTSPSAKDLSAHAQLRMMLGEITKAKIIMDRAVAAGADSPDECYFYGLLHQFIGDTDRAAEIFHSGLMRWPDFGDVAVLLSNVRRQTDDSNYLDNIVKRLKEISINVKGPMDQYQKAAFEAANFKTLSDLGRHEEAWFALHRSNEIMHELNPYNADEEASLTDAIIASSEIISKSVKTAALNNRGSTPIFIVGLPRSGSTLLDRMLSNHTQVTSAGELPDFFTQLSWVTDSSPIGFNGVMESIQKSPGMDFAELGARYLDQTQWRANNKRFYVDKLPMNIRMVHLIRAAIPEARIIRIVRDPMAVCFSNLKAFFGNALSYSYDMKTLAHYYLQYERLVAHWKRTIPDAMQDISYESLVSDPEGTLKDVFRFIGIDMENGCLHPENNVAPVATPSSAQVREAVHHRGIDEWRKYAGHLEPLRVALGAAAEVNSEVNHAT